MATVLELDKLTQYLETLMKAAADEEVRKALNDFKEQLSFIEDRKGRKLPVIRLKSPFPTIPKPVKVNCNQSFTTIPVSLHELEEVLENLEDKEIVEKNPNMKKAVNGIRKEIGLR